MLYFYSGTDREKIRVAVQERVTATKRTVVRINDAHTIEDFNAALQGGGMFGDVRVVVFENVLQNEEMGARLLSLLETLKTSEEKFIVVEDKIDATTRKRVEKYAEQSERFDVPKRAADTTAFDMAYALQRGDKKALWVSYMRELAKGSPPEMLHGILFWAAKQNVMKTSGTAKKRAEDLLVLLAELPHESRRRGVDMEYALERFALSFT